MPGCAEKSARHSSRDDARVFSSIELLIVVALILTIAAMAILNFIRG